MFGKVKNIVGNLNQSEIKNGENPLSYVTRDFFQLRNWNYKKRDLRVHMEDRKMIIESKRNKVSYLSLFETSTNFRRGPKNKKKINIEKDTVVRVSGRTPNNIKTTIYIIEYAANGKKIKTNRIFINKETEINIHPKTKNVRVAIRISGKGEVLISNFKMIQDYISAQQPTTVGQSTFKKISDIKMACIFDEFSMESFSDNISLITFTPENWRTVLSQNRPDLLMVESAWRGNFGSWEFQIGKYNNNNRNKKLKELISWCKRNNIPTAFWNKEDPIHFEKFIGAASLFDYVFTTDANIIYQYKQAVGHNRVYSMQFAANPKEHNPTSINKVKKNKISFAGSYYANRHPDRRKDMDKMLNIAKEFGLEIFDRNYERNKTGDSHFMFPEKLRENIVGTLKYSEIYKAYKDYRLILNVNSVKASPTMFSRRVFEGLACGTPIVSSYSTGIKKTFNDIVVISENEQQLKQRISNLMTDDKSYRELAMRGIREIYRHHTYLHRLEYILDRMKIRYQTVDRNVAVLYSIDNMADFHRALDVIKHQSYQNIKAVFIISLFEGYESLLNNYNNENVHTYLKDYAAKYNDVSELIETDYVAVMNLENEYGRYYIEDLVHASIFSGGDIIGKKSVSRDGDYHYAPYEYQFVDSILKGTGLFKRTILKKIPLEKLLFNEEQLIESLFKEHGASIYSSDQFSIKLMEDES